MLKHVQVSPIRSRADSLSIRSSTSCASSLCGSPEPPPSESLRSHSRASSVSSLSESAPQTTIKIFTACLRQDIEYKTLGVSWDTTSREVVQQLLRRCKMKHRDPRLFYLSMEITVRRPAVKTLLVLDDDSRPALLQACHPKGDSRFCLKMKPGGLIRVHTSALQPNSQYKSLLISEETTSDELLALLLSCYNSLEPVEQYSLYEVCPGQEYQRKLHPDDLPLRALTQRSQLGEVCHFLVRKNPNYLRRQLCPVPTSLSSSTTTTTNQQNQDQSHQNLTTNRHQVTKTPNQSTKGSNKSILNNNNTHFNNKNHSNKDTLSTNSSSLPLCILNEETKNTSSSTTQCGECTKSDKFSSGSKSEVEFQSPKITSTTTTTPFETATTSGRNMTAGTTTVDQNKNLIQTLDTCPTTKSESMGTPVAIKKTSNTVKDASASISAVTSTPSSWHRKSFLRQFCNKCQSTSHMLPTASSNGSIIPAPIPTTREFCYSRRFSVADRTSAVATLNDDTATLVKYSPVYNIRDIRSLVSNSFNSTLTSINNSGTTSTSSTATHATDKKLIEIESFRYLTTMTQAIAINNNNNNDAKVENRNTSGPLSPEAVNTDPSKGLGKFVYI